MWHVIPSRKWKACIKMDVKEIGLYYISWTYWNQDRKYWWVLRCTVPKLRIPKMEGIA